MCLHSSLDHEFHETCLSFTFIVLVNSHQRRKQTRNCVCFHLWCELTLALWCHIIIWSLFFMKLNVAEWQVSWNSCFLWIPRPKSRQPWSLQLLPFFLWNLSPDLWPQGAPQGHVVPSTDRTWSPALTLPERGTMPCLFVPLARHYGIAPLHHGISSLHTFSLGRRWNARFLQEIK